MTDPSLDANGDPIRTADWVLREYETATANAEATDAPEDWARVAELEAEFQAVAGAEWARDNAAGLRTLGDHDDPR